MPEPKRHAVEIDVRYAETDQMGVVHHANYLVWFELVRTELCRQTGYHYADIEERGYLLMVIDAHVTYRRGARYGETVRVSAWVDRLVSRMVVFAYEVSVGDEVLASGRTEHVWVRRDSGKPARIPGFLSAPFAELAGRSLEPA